MEATRFDAAVRERDGLTVIDLQGEIDAAADGALSAAYGVASARPTAVLLDFADVDYINSTGIALIVSVLARARAQRRAVLASGLSDHYREIFDITRLSDFIELFPSLDGAVSRLTEAAG
jgi:anti-anti-sigma factor